MKSLSKKKMWLFAIGQFGWAMLSGLISNWLVYFYQPDVVGIEAGQTLFITQGIVFLGGLTIIGGITAIGRLFDAVTDPWIASLSDRCQSKLGRRIPFLKWSAIPLSISTVLVFCAPVNSISKINSVWIFIFIMIYYLCITAYCTPYAALIPELGHNQEERLNISTLISLTFIVGTAMAYAAPVVWGMFENGGMDRVPAMRVTFAIFAVIACLCMLVPVFTINEKEYANTQPAKGTAFSSLVKTFSNKDFRVFVYSDILYFIALTMFQTGLPYFVTSLLKLEESMSTVYFVAMTALSLVFYIPINMVARKVGKKKLVLSAFAMFAVAYLYTGFFGEGLGISPTVQGFILVVIAALPMAIFGILPQAMVADVSESDAILSGENREGMFYAARTFAFKLGQSISMIIFTGLATIGSTPEGGTTGEGYRIIAFVAFAFCLLGGIAMMFFNEKKVNGILASKEK